MKDADSEVAHAMLVRDGARTLRSIQTEVERRLWQRLRNRQLKGAKFRRQHPIVPYIAAFFCFAARLVIELDGSNHGDERQRRADERRTKYLEERGYRVLRFWNEEVLENIDGVLETISNFL